MENLLEQNKVYNILFRDDEGDHLAECRLSEYGWSLHREVIYYDFTILKSNSDKYRIGGRMILGLDFNDSDFSKGRYVLITMSLKDIFKVNELVY